MNNSTVSLNLKRHNGKLNRLGYHNERSKYPNKKHKNKNIDKSKTSENIELYRRSHKISVKVSDDVKSRKRRIRVGVVKTYDERVAEIIEKNKTNTYKVRDNAVTMVSATVQLGGKIIENSTREQQIEVLKFSYEYLKNKYGEKNIVSAFIHLDETTPHLHFDFVPITEDGRLSAKKVIGYKKELSRLQDDFLKELQTNFKEMDFTRKKDKSLNGIPQKQFEKMTKELNELNELKKEFYKEKNAFNEEKDMYKKELVKELDQMNAKNIKIINEKENVLKRKQDLQEKKEKEFKKEKDTFEIKKNEFESYKLSEQRMLDKQKKEQEEALKKREEELNEKEKNINGLVNKLDQTKTAVQKYMDELTEKNAEMLQLGELVENFADDLLTNYDDIRKGNIASLTGYQLQGSYNKLVTALDKKELYSESILNKNVDALIDDYNEINNNIGLFR